MATASLKITITENSYSVANNTSSCTVKVIYYGNGASWSNYDCAVKLTFNGTSYSGTSTFTTSTSAQTLMTKTVTVSHNSDGSKSVSASASFATGVSIGTLTATASKTLTTIPRYATSSQSLSSKTETTITMKWTSDSTCDKVWYSKDGGSSWTSAWTGSASSGSYTISGLSANTAYSIKTRVRRKDSQLTTDSSAKSVTTYAYPYCSSAPTFTIGSAATLTIYNPLARSVTVKATASDSSSILSTTTTGTSATIPASAASTLYASIPNASSGTYTVKVSYSSNTATKTGTYKVGSSSNPTIGSVTYSDADTSVTAITGDDQTIIPGKSSVTFTASSLSALNSATIASVKINVNSTDYSMTVSGTTATVSGITVNSSTQTSAVVTITDSRGLTGTYTVSLGTVSYSTPTVSATAKRGSGYYSSTDVTVSEYYTVVGSNSTTITLQARQVGTQSYTISQTVTAGTTTVSLDNNYAWEVLLTITDSFGSSSTYTLTVSKGIPLMFFDTSMGSIGVGKFPEAAGLLDIGLDTEIDGEVYIVSSTIETACTSLGWTDVIV